MSTTESTVSGAWPSRHWKSAECSLSTGQQQPSAPLPRAEREIAGRDEALLVRERERDAVLERPQRRADACEADDGVQDEVGLGRVEQLGEVASDLDVLDAETPQRRRRAAASRTRARTRVSSGFAAITSSAWRPMDPVAPSRAIRLSRTVEG